MSWFRKALSITTVYSDSYYTVVDPGEFYEWKFKEVIPKGRIFTKKLPPSNSFTDGMLIATARLSREGLDKKSFGYETNQDLIADIYLQAGPIQSPKELFQKYKKIQSSFDDSVNRFKTVSKVRSYFTSNNNLFRISSIDDSSVSLLNFGSIKDLIKKLAQTRYLLNKESLAKKGRAHEMEEFRRFENAMTFVQNSQIPVDGSKIDLLLHIAKIKPQQTTKLGWVDCFVRLSPEARSSKKLLDRYESLSWIQANNRLM